MDEYFGFYSSYEQGYSFVQYPTNFSTCSDGDGVCTENIIGEWYYHDNYHKTDYDMLKLGNHLDGDSCNYGGSHFHMLGQMRWR
jgi:hypothetical protein